VVAERGAAAGGLLTLCGAFPTALCYLRRDSFLLIPGETSLNVKVQVAFGGVLEVNVAEDQPPARRLDFLLDLLLVRHVPVVSANVRAD